MVMLKVDNSGRGNCMYYAYSISLMYYLRAKKDSRVTNTIFDKFKLLWTEEQKTKLRALLTQNVDQPFSQKDIQTVIEPILGRAIRQFAGESTVQEFLRSPTDDECVGSPKDTPLFTAAQYGIEAFLKRPLHQSRRPELARLIDHGFTNQDYTEAEIYRVSGMRKAMGQFAAIRAPAIVAQFETEWAEKEKEFEGRKPSHKDITFHKTQLLDNIIKDQTVAFFLENKNEHLNQYRDHLTKEYVWGTEETLMTLNRAIQGERHVRNKEGTIDTVYDTPIILHIHRNGRAGASRADEIPDMVLNNQGNVHWTSLIPDAIYSPNPATTYDAQNTPYESDDDASDIDESEEIIWFDDDQGDEAGTPDTVLNDHENAHKTAPKAIASPSPSESPAPLETTNTTPSVTYLEQKHYLEQRLYKLLDDIKVAQDEYNNDPNRTAYNVAGKLICDLKVPIGVIAECRDLLEKEKEKEKEEAITTIITLIQTAAPKLNHNPSLNARFKNFLSSLLDLIPAFLGGRQIRSGLSRLGIYAQNRTPKIFSALERVGARLINAISDITSITEEETASPRPEITSQVCQI